MSTLHEQYIEVQDKLIASQKEYIEKLEQQIKSYQKLVELYEWIQKLNDFRLLLQRRVWWQ